MFLEDTSLGYPLPHPLNSARNVDVPRLRVALEMIDAHVAALQAQTGGLASQKADKAQVAIDIASAVSQAISDLLDGAPEAYDTLVEIADKLNDNDDVVAGMIAAIATKAVASDVDSALAGKVDVDAQTISAKVTATQNARLVFKDIGNNIRALFSLDRLTNAWSVITRHPTNGDINKLEMSGETPGVMTLNGTQVAVGVGAMAYRNVTISTGEPSGGANGDFWAQVE